MQVLQFPVHVAIHLPYITFVVLLQLLGVNTLYCIKIGENEVIQVYDVGILN